MTRIITIAIVIAAAAAIHSTASAQGVYAESSYDYDLGSLPPDVAARVAHLARYGDRFDNVIQQIIAETAKPNWGWTTCEQPDTLAVLALPDS